MWKAPPVVILLEIHQLLFWILRYKMANPNDLLGEKNSGISGPPWTELNRRTAKIEFISQQGFPATNIETASKTKTKKHRNFEFPTWKVGGEKGEKLVGVWATQLTNMLVKLDH